MNQLLKISAILATVSLFSGVSYAADHSADKSATTGVAIDDTGITLKVKSALAMDSRTSALDTKVKTVNGVVVLEGDVASDEAVKAAEEVAKKVEGVKSVDTKGLKAVK